MTEIKGIENWRLGVGNRWLNKNFEVDDSAMRTVRVNNEGFVREEVVEDNKSRPDMSMSEEQEKYGIGPVGAYIEAIKNGEISSMTAYEEATAGLKCVRVNDNGFVKVHVFDDKEWAESRLKGAQDFVAELPKDQQQALYRYMHESLGLRIYR